MARNKDENAHETGRLSRAASAVKRLFSRRSHDESEEKQPEPRTATAKARPTERPIRRETDIPMDVLDKAYTPPLTSSKASFRSDGSDHQQDQEFALGVADERWKDEDRYSNRSGDPRIGTRGRTYEPAEERPRSEE